jgi:hypothetical protein
MGFDTGKLKKLRQYRHEGVIRRFSSDNGISIPESRKIFLDLMEFFYVTDFLSKAANPFESQYSDLKFSMLYVWAIMDEMWHTFLLFSEDYEKFCKKECIESETGVKLLKNI